MVFRQKNDNLWHSFPTVAELQARLQLQHRSLRHRLSLLKFRLTLIQQRRIQNLPLMIVHRRQATFHLAWVTKRHRRNLVQQQARSLHNRLAVPSQLR